LSLYHVTVPAEVAGYFGVLLMAVSHYLVALRVFPMPSENAAPAVVPAAPAAS
jgi:hypothetical protein